MQADVLGITLLVGSFFAFLAIRVPGAFALGASSVLTAWYLDLPLMIVAREMTRGLDSFSLMFWVCIRLITRRSLVQIQPPLPSNFKGLRILRAPCFLPFSDNLLTDPTL